MGKTSVKESLVFDRRGDLCNKLKAFLLQECDKAYIPVCTDQGFRFDWRIIGLEYEKYFGYPHLGKDGTMYPIKPNDISFEVWQKAIPQVRKWIWWVSYKLFYPTRIIGRSNAADRVLLRISVSLLDKIELPKYYIDNMFDNLVVCYYSRKRAYNSYFYKSILGIPF